MKAVIACDKFRGSLPARDVVNCVAMGIRDLAPDVETVRMPVADGGEGTALAALDSGYQRVNTTTAGVATRDVRSFFAMKGDRAVVELAQTCGLALVPRAERRPLTASSRGFGEQISQALEHGCRDLVLALGGSGCSDGGAGMLQALGAHIMDSSGRPVREGGAALADVWQADLTGLDSRLADCSVTVAADVTNPLLGVRGAAAVYGPQKGVEPSDLAGLESALERFADVLESATGGSYRRLDGAGAAGGVGFAAMATLGARMRSGAETVLDLLDFEAALVGADLVVTGEGALDQQTLSGKAPSVVAAIAMRRGVPTIAVCGQLALTPAQVATMHTAKVYALSAIEPDRRQSMSRASELLRSVGSQIARDWFRSELPEKAREA